MKLAIITVGILLIILFAGYTQSGYGKFYNPISTQQQINELVDKKIFIPLKEGEELKVYKSDHMEADNIKLGNNGYVIIGYSSFNGRYENVKNAKRQARKLGAQIVLVKSSYTHTEYIQGQLILPDNKTTYHSGNINTNSNYSYSTNYNSNGYGSLGSSNTVGYGNTHGNYYGSSTTYGTKVVPYSRSIRKYDQMAQYYIKVDTSKNKFGTFMSNPITREERINISKNGIKINYILNNSPAYHSNLLIGDIIVEFDGIEIKDYNHYNDLTEKLLKDFSGTKIVKVYRNGIFRDIKVKF